MAIPRSVRTCRVRPASGLRREGSHHRNRESPVLHSAVQNRCDGIVERHPAQFDIHFLFSGTKIGRSCQQVACKEDPDCFVAAAGGGKEIHQHLPIRGGKSSFFQEFSSGSRYRVFAHVVEDASRQLPLTCTYGMAILLNQQDTIIIVHCNDRNRTAMRQILPGQDCVAVHDLIGSNIPNKPLEVGRGRTNLVVGTHIRQLIRQSIGLLLIISETEYCTS